MDEQSLRFSRSGIAFALFASAITLPAGLAGGLYGVLAVSAWAVGWPSGLVEPSGQGWLAEWTPIFALVGGAACWYVIAAIPLGYVTVLSTVLDENGASQLRPPLMRRKSIAWSDVTEVVRDRQSLTLRIRSGKRYVWLKMNFYKHQREVERFVRQHAPPDTPFTDFGREMPNF